jgi:hypothetical protein
VKTSVLTTSFAALIGYVSFASAQINPDEHAAHHPVAAAASAPNASPETSDQAKMPAAMSRMQDNMKAMQDLMAKIRGSTNPAERQQLMQQHMKAMHDQMDMMRGMGDGQMGMMGVSQMPGGAGATPKDSSSPKDGGMMNHEMMAGGQMMQKRMDMMQMMMEQMLQHQEMNEDSKARK